MVMLGSGSSACNRRELAVAGVGLSGEAMRVPRRRGEDWRKTASPRAWERGESSQVESDRLAWSIPRFGHCTRTLASWTSTMISEPSVSLVNESPLNNSHVRLWQCSFSPFQPLHTISILLGSSGLVAAMNLARTWTLDTSLLAESWKCDEFDDRPIISVSPFSESSTAGTSDSGVRSGAVRCTRLLLLLGGELDRMPVLDVGTGVGYLRCARPPVFWRLAGRGRPGDEESGSKAGRSEAAERFLVPAMVGVLVLDEGGIMAGSVGSAEDCFWGEWKSIMVGGGFGGVGPLVYVDGSFGKITKIDVIGVVVVCCMFCILNLGVATEGGGGGGGGDLSLGGRYLAWFVFASTRVKYPLRKKSPSLQSRHLLTCSLFLKKMNRIESRPLFRSFSFCFKVGPRKMVGRLGGG